MMTLGRLAPCFVLANLLAWTASGQEKLTNATVIELHQLGLRALDANWLADDDGLSSITVAELAFGVQKSRHVAKNRLALEQFLAPLEVASFDHEAALSYGRVRARLEMLGSPIGSMDLLIAAHALSLGVRLVSNNLRAFRRVPGLKLENWV